MSMHDGSKAAGRTLSRRSFLMAAPALTLATLGAPPTRAGERDWPPVFETGRSQFTVVRPRTTMPSLRLQDLRGKDVLLAPKPGRITLINLWATWCAACRLDLPTIASLGRQRRDALDACAICTDTRDIRAIRSFLGSVNVPDLSCYVDTYGAAVPPKGSSDALFKLVGMPITYLVGPSMQIEGYITGAADWLSPEGARLLQFYREQASQGLPSSSS
ncbi:TlpA family protein disulfide reductase [Bradyrhizobium jicamae]|uniref:TlpA family protein disulfide reductase n=1 Tax=Bradyrhizobium jicamae TaxID=280332 RepID=UPI002010DE65|nr:TlpA family protein disulfide reductase [Bradyrhizobium jicamae]